MSDMTHTHATVTTFNCATPRVSSGKIVKRYALGLTIDDADNIRHYASYDRCEQFTPSAAVINQATRTPAYQPELWQ